jgi:hypothetical protein
MPCYNATMLNLSCYAAVPHRYRPPYSRVSPRAALASEHPMATVLSIETGSSRDGLTS